MVNVDNDSPTGVTATRGRWDAGKVDADAGRPVAGSPRRAPGDVAGYDDRELVEALRQGEPWARNALVEKYQPQVQRLVAGALGIDADLLDIVQDVFVRVLKGIHQLKDPAALRSWIASLAVFTARGHIRSRRRWRWIRFLAPEDVPEVPTAAHDPEASATMRAVYKVVDEFPADERLVFTLRFVAEMELTEVAAACRISLATVKRRLARAETRFVALARDSALLRDRLDRGARWRDPSGAPTVDPTDERSMP